MLTLRLLILTSLAFLAISCSSVQLAPDPHVGFKSSEKYPKTYDVYRNEALLKETNASNSSIQIDLSDQRIKLLNNGKVALDSPCCTGKAGKRTPAGTFPITEKIRDKRSTIFGSLYKNGRKVHGGDRRKYRGSYDRYVGASLPYWMRLTGDGIGIHASKYVHRYPKSNGCIRTPSQIVPIIYSKVGKGTKVEVVR